MKYGKIKNIHVILLIIAGLLINIFYTKILLYPSLNPRSDFFQAVTNMILSLLMGFGLYAIGIIPPADAKLFLGYSTLIPVFVYSHGYISYFPSLIILMNSLIPSAFFFIVIGLFHLDLKSLKTEIKQTLSLNKLSKIVFFIFSSYFIFKPMFSYLKFRPDIFSYSLILFVFLEIMNKLKTEHFYILCTVLSVFGILFFHNTILSLSFLTNLFITTSVFIFLVLLISNIAEPYFTNNVRISDLMPGMMTEELVKDGNNFLKKKSNIFTIFDIFRSFKEKFTSDICLTLTEKDIGKLKKMKKEGKVKFGTVRITKTIPLAPFMLLGVLLTFLAGGYFIYLFVLIQKIFYLYFHLYIGSITNLGFV
jgi:hypothetical protein